MTFGGRDAFRYARAPEHICTREPCDFQADSPKEISVRIMTLALVSLLAVFVADSQAFAAKRASGAANPDRQYYQGAARGCGGGAYCYRSGSHSKKH
jgi:hypothetical protein